MGSCLVDDIEDIGRDNDAGSVRIPKTTVVSRRIKTRPRVVPTKEDHDVVLIQGDGAHIPGTHSIYVRTWGCSHNNSDSEYMAGQLASYGYTITDDKMVADLWLLNSCTVKNPAEDDLRNEINMARSCGKCVVVAGCVSQGAPSSEFLRGLSVVGVQQIDRIVEVVEETLKGNSVRLVGMKRKDGKKLGGASLDLPKIRKNPLIEIIAISTGCLNQCTYCKTKHARGELGSYPPEAIVERARQSFEEGVVEIWLTSEDTGAYGKDIGASLPDLLWRLIEVIPNGARMRVGMTNPPYIMEYLEEMGRILAHPRVYSFLHVPVQSGSNSVLSDMRREYTVEDFKELVMSLRSSVPGINIATDIICGFPTETAEDFQETLELISSHQFSSVFINQFFPRPGTPAANMPRIPANQVKLRTKELSALFHSYRTYDHKIGETQTVLITEKAHDGVHLVGHNQFYEQVLIGAADGLMGKMVDVKITAATKFSMVGEVLSVPQSPTDVQPLPQGVISGLAPKKKEVPPPSQRYTFAAAAAAATSILVAMYNLIEL